MQQSGRLSELQQFASRTSARRVVRGGIIRSLAEHLDPDEVLEVLVSSRPDAAATVVVVTSERVLVARQQGLDEPVAIEAIERSSIIDVAVLHGGGVTIATRAGVVELSPFAPDDIDALSRTVGRTRRRPAQVPRKRSTPHRRRAVTELDMIATLLQAGVLTEAEHDLLRTRLLARAVAG